MTSKRWGALLLAIVTVTVLGVVTGRTKKELPDLGALPEFSLIERTGRPLTRDELRGKVWVASFLFTSCSGQCPILVGKLRSLQKELVDAESFRIVSFTVDPETDTPEVLRSYAATAGADPYRWLFATGDKTRIESLIANGFHVAGGLEHSSHFVLVDKNAHLRGFYDANDAAAMKKLFTDVRMVLTR